MNRIFIGMKHKSMFHEPLSDKEYRAFLADDGTWERIQRDWLAAFVGRPSVYKYHWKGPYV